MAKQISEFNKRVARLTSQYCKSQGIRHQDIADYMSLSKSQVDNWFSTGQFTAKAVIALTEHFHVPKEIFKQGEYSSNSLSTERIADMLTRMEAKIKELEERIYSLEKH